MIFRAGAGGHSAPAVILTAVKQGSKKDPKSDKRKLASSEVEDKQIISATDPDASGSYDMEYTGKIDGAMLHRLEHVMMQDGISYTLTYTAPPQAYEEQLFLAEAIMNSFSPSTGSR